MLPELHPKKPRATQVVVNSKPKAPAPKSIHNDDSRKLFEWTSFWPFNLSFFTSNSDQSVTTPAALNPKPVVKVQTRPAPAVLSNSAKLPGSIAVAQPVPPTTPVAVAAAPIPRPLEGPVKATDEQLPPKVSRNVGMRPRPLNFAEMSRHQAPAQRPQSANNNGSGMPIPIPIQFRFERLPGFNPPRIQQNNFKSIPLPDKSTKSLRSVSDAPASAPPKPARSIPPGFKCPLAKRRK
jgi:hypothetical protein